MNCPSCQHENRAGAKFCKECAAPLPRLCESCSAPLPPAAKFCDECGTPVAAPAAPADRSRPESEARSDVKPSEVKRDSARKVVTIVFADLVGSTALHERLDAEAVGRFMDAYYAATRAAVEAHGGVVTQLLGDGVKAVFGEPRVAEDDAIRALRAAVEMQRAFRALADSQRAAIGETGLRVAVNTGEVVVNAGSEIIGDPVNVAARLQEKARDGDVVIGGETQRLVASLVRLERLGTFALKGRAEPVAAYRVVSLERPGGASASEFVGRELEVARLRAAYDAACAAPATKLAVLLGSPGLGKSRLMEEFAHGLGGTAAVVAAHCEAAGGASFAPLARALREHLGVGDAAGADATRAALEAVLPGAEPESARIRAGIAALLAGTPASPEETFFVVRRLLAALASAKPLVLAIDDLHWAEPLLLDLVEHLVQWGAGVRMLVLVGARPELRESRSALATPGGFVADVIPLAGLDAGAAMRLAAGAIGAADLPAAVAAKLLATSEGNPLFVGELARMLVADGVLEKSGERWALRAGVTELEMPPTIHALLAARIERLRPEERGVLEHAAVIGRQFSRSALAALLPAREAEALDARLEALRRGELIERDPGWFLGEPGLRFHHVLIRDAAYRRVLKGTRAELHAKFASWVEARAGESLEHDETIGWHYEQAHEHLREIGPLDARGVALGARAATRLAAAGRRALARDDVQLAGGLLRRALDRSASESPLRAELALDACEALLASGEVGKAGPAIDELESLAGDSERLRAWHTCFRGQLLALTEPESLRQTAESVAAAAAQLAALGDAAGEAKAHYVHARALGRLGRVGASEAALDLALAAARRAGDRRRANTVLAEAPLAALWGPSPVTRASGRCLDVVRVLRITQGAPAVEAVALSCQGVLEALRGRTEAARRMLASSRRMVEELGIASRLHETDVFAARIELLEGDAAAAERGLRAAYEGLRELGLGIDAARAAALLARALLAQGRASEAEALSRESEALAGDDLQAAIAWRGVRAEALAQRGEHADAIALAQAAVALASATDALLDHADARMALAAVLRAAGNGGEADAEERRARELWEAKGATRLMERARGEASTAPRAVAPAPPALAVEAPRRRVRENAASTAHARLEAAIRARDLVAVHALLADSFTLVDHRYGGLATDRSAFVQRSELLIASPGSELRAQPLATLGDSLALARVEITAQGGASSDHFADAGEASTTLFSVCETDSSGRLTRDENFAADRLGHAIARLYARYAESLPAGVERARAAGVAETVPLLDGPVSADPLAPRRAEGFTQRDHRRLGEWSIQSLNEVAPHNRAARAVADVWTGSVLDIIAARPEGVVLDGGLKAVTYDGVEAEFRALWVQVYSPDGLLQRTEIFDEDRIADALARFDELTAQPASSPRVLRRIRENGATSVATRYAAAIRGHDTAAIAALFSDDLRYEDRTLGLSAGRAELQSSNQAFLEMRDAHFSVTPVATLGDSLALVHHRIVARGRGEGGEVADVGAVEFLRFALYEVDASSRLARLEVYDEPRLNHALARLYQRYAEALPDGVERTRAASTARSVTAMLTSMDLENWQEALDPNFAHIDRRTLGIGSQTGTEPSMRGLHVLFGESDDLANRIDDVLAVLPGWMLVRWVNTGVVRGSGGSFERQFLWLGEFGADGRALRIEQFDTDAEAEALARFDELTARAAPGRRIQRRVRPNAATAAIARFDAAVEARDIDAMSALYSEAMSQVEHATGATYGREGVLESLRQGMRISGARWTSEVLATLGDSLVLARRTWRGAGSGSAAFDVGEHEREEIGIAEVDEAGLVCAVETFAPDRLGEARSRLYARYAERLLPGPERERAAAIARIPFGLDRDFGPLEAALDPAVEMNDRRLTGAGRARGRDAVLGWMRALADLSSESHWRIDDILALSPSATLLRVTNSGVARAGGGAFERSFLALRAYGADGRITHWETFEAGRAVEALARFDELTAGASSTRPILRHVRANAATATAERNAAAINGRDVSALGSLLAERFELVDHVNGVAAGRAEFLRTSEMLLEFRDVRFRQAPLATLGESLALCRQSIDATGAADGRNEYAEVGAFHGEWVVLHETDAEGRLRLLESFAAERLGVAAVRLYERYAELRPRGPERERAAATARSFRHGFAFSDDPTAQRSWIASVADAAELVDHRVLGFGSLRGRGAISEFYGAMAGLEHFRVRVDDVVRLEPNALLVHTTTLGTARAGGGAFDRQILHLWVCGGDGLVSHAEFFDAEQQAEALERFDELTAGSGARTPQQRAEHRFANAASRALGGLFNRRDWAGIEAAVAPEFVFDERRRMLRNTCGREIWLEQMRLLLDEPHSRFTSELLATRGERLSLHTSRFESEVPGGGGPLEVEEHLALNEVGRDGRLVALVLFDRDAEDDAFAELDARYESGGSPIVRAQNALVRVVSQRDWDAANAHFAEEYAVHDHRPLAVLGTLRGRDAWARANRALVEIAPDTRVRIDHVRDCGRGVLWQSSWRGSRDGSQYEIPFVGVTEWRNGTFVREDVWDVDHVSDALARFAELSAPATKSPSAHFENAASRADAALFRCFNARDWAGVEALAAPSLVFDERRRLVRNSCGREVWLEQFRLLFDSPKSHFASELVATRGERLALNLHHFEAEVAGGGGALEMPEHLCVHEVDADGRIVAIVLFDLEDRDAAYAELDARFDSGEGAARARLNSAFIGAVARRDWDAVVALCSPAFVEHDHRRLAVLGTTHDAAAWARNFSTLVHLAPDTLYRADHIRVGARGFWGLGTWHGQRDGGRYEIPLAPVVEVDDQQRIVRADLYDGDQLEAALARFAELSAPPAQPESPFANAASRAVERGSAAIAARDWDGFAALLAPSFVNIDRTPIARLEVGREEWLAAFREQIEMTSGPLVPRILATRGERLALAQLVWQGAAGDIGPSEIVWLLIIEVDARGDHVAGVSFDPGDLDAAYAELDARFAAGEGAQHPDATAWAAGYQRSFAERDWAAMERLVAFSEIAENHRLVGWGTLHGPTWVPTLEALVELAPDVRERVDHLRTCERGLLWSAVRRGTREGGEFEMPFLLVVELDERGRQIRLDVWDTDALPEARSRFEQIRARARSPALSRFENAAWRTTERTIDLWRAGDWDAFAKLCAPGFRYSDRRKHVRLDLDLQKFVEHARQTGDMTTRRIEIRLLATRGERLALVRELLEVADGDLGRTEYDSVYVCEVDERGAILANLRFDAEDLAGSTAELDARFAAGESRAHPLARALLSNYLRAFAARDWPAMTALFMPDLVAQNRRLAGWGTLHGAESIVATMRAQVELAPDTQERVDHVRLSARGVLLEYAWHGTYEGGAFENLWIVGFALDASGCARRVEVWESEQQEAALAWFASLESTEPRDPRAAIAQPNRASEWLHRFQAAFNRRDWDAVRALYAADATYEDRQRLSLVRGGLDLMLSSTRARADAGAFLERIESLGTAGGRMAVQRLLWAGGGSADRFEMEHLAVQEVDETGLLVANLNFDPGDTHAAQREMWSRWVKHEPELEAVAAAAGALIDATNARDHARLRAALADDLIVEDRRRTGMGRIEGADAYTASFAALFDLVETARVEAGWVWHAVDRHGAVIASRRTGTLPDGGAFESEFLLLFVVASGRVTSLEMFELDALDAALARFEALRSPLAAID